MTLVALNINNLTDARYYSARGAEYLTFKFPNSIEEAPTLFKRIQDILDWVEGVKILFQCTLENVGLIQQLKPPFEIAGFVLPYNAPSDSFSLGKIFYEFPLNKHKILTEFSRALQEIPKESSVFFTWNDTTDAFDIFASKIMKEDKWADVFLFYDSYLETTVDSETAILLIQTLRPNGILMNSGEEEVVGEKNYDAEDDFLDKLEELEWI